MLQPQSPTFLCMDSQSNKATIFCVNQRSKNVKKLRKYCAFILLIAPLLFLPMDWYRNMQPDELLIQARNSSGLFALLEEHGRIAIVYLLCLIIQWISIRYKCQHFSILSNLILIGILIAFPLLVIAEPSYVVGWIQQKIYSIWDVMQLFYAIGFYITVFLILLSVIMNFIQWRNQKRKEFLL